MKNSIKCIFICDMILIFKKFMGRNLGTQRIVGTQDSLLISKDSGLKFISMSLVPKVGTHGKKWDSRRESSESLEP